MYNQKITDTPANFKYIIVTPEIQNVPDTFFNRFNYSIFASTIYLESIAKLPVHLKELIEGWPFTPKSSNHDIVYINEMLLKQETLHLFQSYIYGAFFVLEGVRLDTIQLIKKYTRLPVISNKEEKFTMICDEDLTLNLFRYWDKSTTEISNSIPKENRSLEYFTLENLTSLDGYNTLSTHFLRPLHSTISRLRGLYNNLNNGLYTPEPLTPDNYEDKEAEADKEILKAVKQLIVEKYVSLIVYGYVKGNFRDEASLSSFGIEREEIKDLYEKKDETSYNKIVSKILSNFESLYYKTDMVLCLPSINYHLLMKINGIAKKDKLPKKVLRLFYDSNSYYHTMDNTIFNGSSEKRKEFNFNSFMYSSSQRAKELALLSSLNTLYSLGRQIPFIRTRNVPSQKFYSRAFALSRYSVKMEERNKVSDFVRTFKKLTSVITGVVPDEQWEVILNYGNHIKVLSDMPVEWANFNGLPLCIEKKFSRVPITPGNGLISHSYVLKNEYIVSKDNLSVLIINTLNKNDPLYQVSLRLKEEVDKYLIEINSKTIYREASTKEEFISIIEQNQPVILIYYGHGSYDSTEDLGKLHIGNDFITALEIENIKHTPLITILGACETQVLHGTHVNTAALFLGNLSVSVLGTFFPIDGLKAMTFISSLIRNLVNALTGVAPENYFESWDDIILQTYRSHYLLEPVHSIESYLVKRGEHLKTYIQSPITEFFQVADKKKRDGFIEILRDRDNIYMELFSKHKKLEDAFQSLQKNNLLLPESLYFSSLGSPEVIKLKREKTTDTKKYSLFEYVN